ncbi:MAG: dUTP diphosphatase [Crocinitomicaceae bacterium]|jgi:dUTP pyrophosphatase|nr:dUTP diphosphatase [Crocinitomicaceae bacterium]
MEGNQNSVNVKVKKIFSAASVPSYTKKGDAGIDLVAISLKKCAGFYEYGTGLAMEIPEGYAGFVFPRSSISNTDHYLRNSVGVIDSGYRGEIKVRMSTPLLGGAEYKEGDRVAQLVIMKLPWVNLQEVEELSDTDRGEGGFGSTGK